MSSWHFDFLLFGAKDKNLFCSYYNSVQQIFQEKIILEEILLKNTKKLTLKFQGLSGIVLYCKFYIL